MEYTIHGWPQYREDVQLAARDFIIRGKLSLHDGLLVRGDGIVVPFSLRKQILDRIHEGHMGVAKGIAKCLRGKIQRMCCTISGVATDWKRHKIMGRQLPTLPGEAAIPGQ